MRAVAPLTIVTADARQPNCRATSVTSSSLALPSTGGAFKRATQLPSSSSANDDSRERGLTFTWITVLATGGLRCAAALLAAQRQRRADRDEHAAARLVEAAPDAAQPRTDAVRHAGDEELGGDL